MTSESRERLLQLVAAQAETASPDRARTLEDLSASIEQRPSFFVDVLRPDLLDWPEVTRLLDSYGTDDADPDRFLQTLDTALRHATGYGGPRAVVAVREDGVALDLAPMSLLQGQNPQRGNGLSALRSRSPGDSLKSQHWPGPAFGSDR